MRSAVEQCSVARMSALVDRDLDRLEALLADDLRYVHATGIAHDRQAYLSFVQDQLQFLDVRLEEAVIKEVGAVAIVTGRLVQRVIRRGENEPVTLSSWAIEVWRRTGGVWRLLDFQSTRLPVVTP